MKKLLSNFGRRFQNYIFSHRLGKNYSIAKFLFRVMTFFDRYEEYSNTFHNNNFDHYVPKLLLRRFEINNINTTRGKVYEYNFTVEPPSLSDINSIAGQVGFDSFRDLNGNQSDYISRKLYSENLELRSSAVIKLVNISDKNVQLTPLERSTLAVFVSYQFTRVPYFRESLKKFIEYLIDHSMIKVEDLSNSEIIDKIIVRNEKNITYDEIINYIPKVKYSGMDNHILLISLLIAESIAFHIHTRTLKIFETTGIVNECFVISNNPVVLLDLERHEVLRFPCWWEINQNNLMILMPTSPKRCILFSKGLSDDGSIENEVFGFLNIVNFGQFLNSSSVYSHNKDVLTSLNSKFKAELLLQGKLYKSHKPGV